MGDGVALAAAAITVTLGDARVLAGVDLEVGPGEVVGLIGPNGAGKSTLLDAVCGFVPLDAGRVWLDGAELSDLLPYQRARAGLARSFQDARLYPTMSVREVLRTAFADRQHHGLFAQALRLGPARREEEQVAAAAEALLDLVDLRSYLDHRVAELSFGTTRAVELAWLAARQPRVLLLDEPASGLQQSEVEVLGALITEIRGDAAVVLVDHDVPFVAGLADRLVALDLGSVLAVGTADDVLEDPAVVSAYLGDGTYTRRETNIRTGVGAGER